MPTGKDARYTYKRDVYIQKRPTEINRDLYVSKETYLQALNVMFPYQAEARKTCEKDIYGAATISRLPRMTGLFCRI